MTRFVDLDDNKKCHRIHQDGEDASNVEVWHIIKNTQVEAEEVKRGVWICEEGSNRCSCCGNKQFKYLMLTPYADWRPRYCPHCGALMWN